MKLVRRNRQNGFTLVELMVALVLTSLATIGLYQTYVSFSTSYDVQDQVAEMQQNLRVAMQRLVRDIRMAGYNQAAGAGFLAMNAAQISFTVLNDTTGSLETITYDLDAGDLDRNGFSVIQNVDALDFTYLDENGNVAASLAAIRTVLIAIVVRTTNEDFAYTDNGTYLNLLGTTILAPQNDNFHRRVLSARVKCRNMEF